jgi:hypothetical protein
VWDVDTGKIVSGPFIGHDEGVASVAFSSDGKHVASGSDDKTIRVWDVDTGQIVSAAFTGHDDWVTSVAFSPDGKHIASGSWDKTYGILTLVRLCLGLSLAMMKGSPLLHSHLMESMLHLGLEIRQSECGMLALVRLCLHLSLAMMEELPLLHSHLMECTLHLAQMTGQ